MRDAFGDQCYISEFHIDFNDMRLRSVTADQSIWIMNQIYGAMRSMGYKRARVYQWVGSLNASNQFAMKYMDESFNPLWDVLVGNKRRTFVP